MARVTADTSEVRAFAARLDAAGPRVAAEATAVVKHGANNIKEQLVSEAKRSRHFKGFAPGISYDITTTSSGVEAEIGPVKGRPGSLANIAYFGTSRGGGTVSDPQGALDAEAPNLERHLGEIGENAP